MSKKTETNQFEGFAKSSDMSVVFNMLEESVFASALDPVSQLQPYNPDDLYQKDGDYRSYNSMLNDDQVSVCSQLKKDLVLGGGWEISVSDDSLGDIKGEIDRALRNELERPLDDIMRDILSAYDFGFSVSEKVFKKTDGNKVALKNIKTRNPVTWLIHQDDYGNIIDFEQRSLNNSLHIEPYKLIHYANNSRFSNPYGESDLRPAYAAWFIKKNIIRYLAIFLEKAASPVPVAKCDSNLSSDDKLKLFNLIKTFQTKTAMVIPKSVEIDFLEAKTNGEAYHTAINLMNMFIARSMFIPDLAGFGGSETDGGSYSLGEHQLNIFFNHINQRRASLENIINKHIVTPMVINNYGKMDVYPEFRLLPVDDKEAIELAKVWLEAVKGRVYKPSEQEVKYFLQLCRFPEPKEIDFGGSQSEDQEDKEKLTGEEKDAEDQEVEEEKEEFSFTSNKTNIKLIKSIMDATELSIIDDTKELFTSIIDDYINKVASKRVIESENIALINKIKIKKSNRARQIINKHMKDAFNAGIKTANNESRTDFAATKEFDEEFLKMIEEENLNFINDWEYSFSKRARQKIIEGIKDGRPVSSVLSDLRSESIKYTKDSLERYSRTKTTEVLNKGRLAVFSKSEFIQGFKYSAIIDGRTTEICSGLHNKVFTKGNEPIPPMHFNCRSVLIPITVAEEMNEDKKIGEQSIEEFIKKNKGKGFSKR